MSEVFAVMLRVDESKLKMLLIYHMTAMKWLSVHQIIRKMPVSFNYNCRTKKFFGSISLRTFQLSSICVKANSEWIMNFSICLIESLLTVM